MVFWAIFVETPVGPVKIALRLVSGMTSWPSGELDNRYCYLVMLTSSYGLLSFIMRSLRESLSSGVCSCFSCLLYCSF